MADSVQRLMTPEEFFQWQLDQDDLYELVEGVPVKMLKMMTGTSLQHDLVVVNLIIWLTEQLRGSRCRPTTDGVAVRTKIRNVRRPDVTVECAPLVRDTYKGREPKLVVEVLSPSTTNVDRVRKLDEYKRYPTLSYNLLIDTRAPIAAPYVRRDSDWEDFDFAGLDAVIAPPDLAVRLTLAEVYEGLSFGLDPSGTD
jgi:Uma2 family endonuclease